MLTIKATNYYADSQGGLNTNNGLSPEKAWKSFFNVSTAPLIPGDTVFFKRGSNFSQSNSFEIHTSGSAASPIVFTYYGSGNKPQFINTSTSQWAEGIVLYASWVVLDGLMVKDISTNGIHIDINSRHNVIRNCELTNSGCGISINGKYNLITDNYFYRMKMIVNDSAPDNDYGATAITVCNGNNEISYNRMDSCYAPSFDYGEDGGAIELWADHAIIDSCYFHHNFAYNTDGFLEAGGTSTGVIKGVEIAYNQYVNNRGAIISWLHFPSATGNFGVDIQAIRYENNTLVVLDPKTNYNPAIGWDGTPGSNTSLTLRNNILYTGNFEKVISGLGAFTSSHNLYYKDNKSKTIGFTINATDQIANPLFVNLSENNYHFLPTSPAINKGMQLGFNKDIENKEIQGLPDQGAYEYQLGTGISKINSKSNYIRLYPNPAHDKITIDFEGRNCYELSVFDIRGNLHLTENLELNSKMCSIDLMGWNEGMYLIKLLDHDGISKTKFIIQ